MKVGDYVRTKDGEIGEIRVIIEDKVFMNTNQYYSTNIIKSSPNIIDLIEVGDYVNGKKVIDIFTDYIFNYSEEFKVIMFSKTDVLHDVKHIKSIVTKESMESVTYYVK